MKALKSHNAVDLISLVSAFHTPCNFLTRVSLPWFCTKKHKFFWKTPYEKYWGIIHRLWCARERSNYFTIVFISLRSCANSRQRFKFAGVYGFQSKYLSFILCSFPLFKMFLTDFLQLLPLFTNRQSLF